MDINIVYINDPMKAMPLISDMAPNTLYVYCPPDYNIPYAGCMRVDSIGSKMYDGVSMEAVRWIEEMKKELTSLKLDESELKEKLEIKEKEVNEMKVQVKVVEDYNRILEKRLLDLEKEKEAAKKEPSVILELAGHNFSAMDMIMMKKEGLL